MGDYSAAYEARMAQQNAAQNEQDQADQAERLEKYKATVETNRANNAARTEAARQQREADFQQSMQKLIKSQE
jgi:hypothetical protein